MKKYFNELCKEFKLEREKTETGVKFIFNGRHGLTFYPGSKSVIGRDIYIIPETKEEFERILISESIILEKR